MPASDRTGFIALLEQLRQDDDAAVVAAARDIIARMDADGLTWEALIVDADTDDDFDDGDDDATEFVPVSDASSDAELIDNLLARDDLSDDTRDELTGYKQDIAEGEFTEADSQYLQALAKRLSA